MQELLVGIIAMIALYLFGKKFLPEPNTHKPIIPEPWQIQYKIHEKNMSGDDDE